MEEEASKKFLSGKAAFLRSWSSEYAKLKQSGISFEVAPLPVPKGRRGEKSSSVLGGWQLAVPKYSLSQGSAIEFIRYLSSSEVQKWRAREGTYQPTIEKLIKEVDVQEALPFLKDSRIRNAQPIIRPSSRLEDRYNEVSICIYEWVDSALKRDARKDIEQDIVEMEKCIERASNPDISDDVPSGLYDLYDYVP
jgi:trehalose/maltose transport system substrate-binding protein